MRLLTYDAEDRLGITSDLPDDSVPPYAILSHTWGRDEEEVIFRELGQASSRHKAGYQKIEFCGKQAQKDGWRYFWIDTCCIDKANLTELSKAITSMYRWYKSAQVCYVYLADVSHSTDRLETVTHGDVTQRPWEAAFRASRWFTRGWTLQELLAPREVVFYSQEGCRLGSKSELQNLLHAITSIPLTALDGQPLSQFSVAERMQWTKDRKTKEKEDRAYCLLGIFEVYMPLIYGEGENAFRRLRKEIDGQSAVLKPLGLCLTSAPLIQPDEFVGRAVEIDTIHDVLRPGKLVAQQQRAVLGGMGGVGKTQLAIAYARQYQDSYSSVLWLNAATEITLYDSIRSVGHAFISSPALDNLDNKQILNRFHEWLAYPGNTRWLLIFDNYDDPDKYRINDFCPNVGYGSVIVTTRLPDRVHGFRVRVQPLTSKDESLEILQKRSGRENVDTDGGARRLAERLGGLPLALASAGAFLRRSTLGFQQYLDEYERRWQIEGRRPLQLQEYTDRTLYTTWNLSYDRLKKDDTEAAQMLQLLAYFDHQRIWYTLISGGLSKSSPDWLRLCSTEQTEFENVMCTLIEYCFVEFQTATGSYSMHSCVHDWALRKLNEIAQPVLYWYAFDCVAASVSRDRYVLQYIQHATLVPHALRLTHRHFEAIGQDIAATRLDTTNMIALLLQKQFQLDTAAIMYQRMLSSYEKSSEPDQHETLDLVENLGNVYLKQEKLVEAERMYERALAGQEKLYGPDCASTVNVIANLGLLYYRQNKLDQAEQMSLRALASMEQVLGPEHLPTLKIASNLGHLYMRQGKLDQAEQMYTRALAGKEKVFGSEHSSTLTAVVNLARLHMNQGKLDQTEQMLKRALDGQEKTLGPEHPATLTVIFNLGCLYMKQHELEQAEQMFLRTLAAEDKTLGPEHSTTLKTAAMLGEAYERQGKEDEMWQILTRIAKSRYKPT